MKKIYVLLFSCVLLACSDKNQEEFQSSSNGKLDEMPMITLEQQSTTSGVLVVSKTKDDQEYTVLEKENGNDDKIICSNQNITEWYGFDESEVEPKCKVIKKFKLPTYKCDISKNAFGADKDAILLENNDQNIFVYSDDKVCNEMLEIRNSNAP
jgi:hypothetical protein